MFLANQVALTPSRLPIVQEKLRALPKDKMFPKIFHYSICIGTHADNYMHHALKGFPDTTCILLCVVAANQQRNVSSIFFVIVPGGICFIVHLELCLCSLIKAAGYKDPAGRKREAFPSLRELLSVLKAEDLTDSEVWLRQSVTFTGQSLKLMKERYRTTVESTLCYSECN